MKLVKGRTYRTVDKKIWFCIGYIKRKPVCVNWTGSIFKLAQKYQIGITEDSWAHWLEQHKYFWLNCVVLGTIEKYHQSVNKILNLKIH